MNLKQKLVIFLVYIYNLQNLLCVNGFQEANTANCEEAIKENSESIIQENESLKFDSSTLEDKNNQQTKNQNQKLMPYLDTYSKNLDSMLIYSQKQKQQQYKIEFQDFYDDSYVIFPQIEEYSISELILLRRSKNNWNLISEKSGNVKKINKIQHFLKELKEQKRKQKQYEYLSEDTYILKKSYDQTQRYLSWEQGNEKDDQIIHIVCQAIILKENPNLILGKVEYGYLENENENKNIIKNEKVKQLFTDLGIKNQDIQRIYRKMKNFMTFAFISAQFSLLSTNLNEQQYKLQDQNINNSNIQNTLIFDFKFTTQGQPVIDKIVSFEKKYSDLPLEQQEREILQNLLKQNQILENSLKSDEILKYLQDQLQNINENDGEPKISQKNNKMHMSSKNPFEYGLYEILIDEESGFVNIKETNFRKLISYIFFSLFQTIAWIFKGIANIVIHKIQYLYNLIF